MKQLFPKISNINDLIKKSHVNLSVISHVILIEILFYLVHFAPENRTR